MNRRQFIKTVGMTAGGLSIARYADAFNLVPLIPQGKGGTSGTSNQVTYANWTMDSESTLSGVNFVMFCQGGLGENEYGMSPAGTISGVNLVGTQSGNIAASADGKSRVFDGVDDYMTLTAACANTSLGNSSWTVLCRVKNVEIPSASKAIFEFASGSLADLIWIYRDPSVDEYGVKVGGVPILSSQPGSRISNATDVICGLWCDGTYVRGGSCVVGSGSGAAGQPTKWSDFAAAYRVSTTSACDFSAVNFNALAGFWNTYGRYLSATYYWLILDSTCLIDNAA